MLFTYNIHHKWSTAHEIFKFGQNIIKHSTKPSFIANRMEIFARQYVTGKYVYMFPAYFDRAASKSSSTEMCAPDDSS